MKKTILVTAGNTSEPIDRVRTITNTSSGRLGALIADTLMAQGHNVVYLCGKNAAQPADAPLETVAILGVSDLAVAVDDLCARYQFDGIVHAMAVSDYTVQGVLPMDELAAHLRAGTRPALTTGGKLKSSMTEPVILLRPAPKIIARFKQYQPKTLLVGFKLLVDVPEAELLGVAAALLEKNDCDLVCANDLTRITADGHHATILDKTGVLATAETKQEIAAALAAQMNRIWSEGP